MSQINIAEAVANHAVFREKRVTPAGATQMYRFLAANEESLPQRTTARERRARRLVAASISRMS
jgi:hypothetical protein